MKKLLLAGIFVSALTQFSVTQTTERDMAVEYLAAQTAARKGLKNAMWWAQVAAIPTLGITLITIYPLLWAIRQGYTLSAQYYFRKLYNKKVDYYGNLISPFHAGTEGLCYALTDEQFILFGFAAGFTTTELVHLANKAGRYTVSAKIGHNQQMSQFA